MSARRPIHAVLALAADALRAHRGDEEECELLRAVAAWLDAEAPGGHTALREATRWAAEFGMTRGGWLRGQTAAAGVKP